MKIKGFVLDGKLLHIGDEWPHNFMTPVGGGEDEVVDVNPCPDGAIFGEHEVTETAKGRLVLSSDYATCRHDTYPSLADQLDALWKGGEFLESMKTKVLAVKATYPKD